jgi:antitoxin ParD1/3/4
MVTMNVSLPSAIKDWVEAQTRTGRYGNVSDYVRDLIPRDQERVAKHEEMQRLITEGFMSGVSPRSMRDILKIAREQAAATPRDHDV